MFFEKARQYALYRLERELPSDLVYHGSFHTRDEVVPACQNLAKAEGVTGESLTLLLTAAWFHDLGYVEQALHHELVSARIAREILPEFDYSLEQVDAVEWAILSTALPQAPVSLIDQILVDSDLEVLGREHFMTRNNDLRRELAYLGKEFTDSQWFSSQLKFVEKHNYFTAAAHALLDAQKQRNITDLRSRLEAAQDKSTD